MVNRSWRRRTPYNSETVEADGPGNVVMLVGHFKHIYELTTGFGQRVIPAEKVADTASKEWLRYEVSGVTVGEHLADQLLLPVALAGSGSFFTMHPSLRTTTNVDTITRFLPVRFSITPISKTASSI